MEPAKIDWKTIESVYLRDDTYETINAPQWIDLLDPHNDSVDDEAWFCRSDCKHPKTAEDFLKSTPTSKLLRSVSVSKLIGLGDWNWNREGNLKKRGGGQVAPQQNEAENQNPNLATPPPRPARTGKAAIKSSAEKKETCAEEEENSVLIRPEESRRLKSTMSAKDLFGGRDILGKITDLCNEIKRMATIKTTTNEEEEEDNVRGTELASSDSVKQEEVVVEVGMNRENLEKEEETAAAAAKENQAMKQQKPMVKKKPRGILMDTENVPVNVPPPMSLDLKRIKASDQIRTSPPTPQGFSAANSKKPPNNNNNKNKKREPFKEVVLEKLMTTPPRKLKEELAADVNKNNSAASDDDSPVLPSGTGARSLDIFWFFKPCAL